MVCLAGFDLDNMSLGSGAGIGEGNLHIDDFSFDLRFRMRESGRAS